MPEGARGWDGGDGSGGGGRGMAAAPSTRPPPARSLAEARLGLGRRSRRLRFGDAMGSAAAGDATAAAIARDERRSWAVAVAFAALAYFLLAGTAVAAVYGYEQERARGAVALERALLAEQRAAAAEADLLRLARSFDQSCRAVSILGERARRADGEALEP